MEIEVIGSEESPLDWQDYLSLTAEDRLFVKHADQKDEYFGNWIYRGQSNVAWQLETSLERYNRETFDDLSGKYSVKNYFTYLSSIVPSLNSLLDKSFTDIKDETIDLGKWNCIEVPKDLKIHELLCYARHLGFPSPLLDWTKSFYIALFFAFRHSKLQENVAIYSYISGSSKSWGNDDPLINEVGDHIQTHPRHFRQHSTYTYCCSSLNNEQLFRSHEDAVKINVENQKIKKFILSGSQKKEVLEHLYMMNINDYTLFGDEESLMRTLAYRAFHKLF